MSAAAFQVSGSIGEAEHLFWSDARLAARLFSMLLAEQAGPAPSLLIRAQAGPVLDHFLQTLEHQLSAGSGFCRVPQGVDTNALIGGVDLSATLEAGRLAFHSGLLQRADGGVLLLPMAQGMDGHNLAVITAALDNGNVTVERDGISRTDNTRFGLVAIDQSEIDEDGPSGALADRCCMHLDLTSVSMRCAMSPEAPYIVHDRSVSADCSEELLENACQMAIAFGLTSLRPAQQCVAIARAHARMFGRTSVGDDDLTVAMRLALLQRAKQMPQAPLEEEQADQSSCSDEDRFDGSDSQSDPQTDGQSFTDGQVKDSVVEAVQALLPDDLLRQLIQPALVRQSATAGRSGVRRNNFKRGRPLASRAGRPGGHRRLDLIATMRKAVPWQKMRKHNKGFSGRVQFRSSDFQIRRFKQSAETATIFAVDASGSTALNRLGEAKGAIELLLSDSYARRDSVALISIRGKEAELLLPPTRALAQAKRALSALPGGGGTPLASGLRASLALALEEMRKGRQTSVVVLTDGSANVALDGSGGRQRAIEDALVVAKGFATQRVPVIIIDVGRKPGRHSASLADAMGADLVAMPFASADALSNAVREKTGSGRQALSS